MSKLIICTTSTLVLVFLLLKDTLGVVHKRFHVSWGVGQLCTKGFIGAGGGWWIAHKVKVPSFVHFCAPSVHKVYSDVWQSFWVPAAGEEFWKIWYFQQILIESRVTFVVFIHKQNVKIHFRLRRAFVRSHTRLVSGVVLINGRAHTCTYIYSYTYTQTHIHTQTHTTHTNTYHTNTYHTHIPQTTLHHTHTHT